MTARQRASVGTVDHDGRRFLIEADPHVVLVLKRVFPKIEKSSHGVLRLTETPDVCRDLEWFLQRYPLDVRSSAARRMRAGAMEYRERMTVVEALLAGSAAPRAFDLAVPLREYQRVAAEIALRTGGLLLADDVGLGKAQPLEEPVLTPDGWVAIGDLVVGDEVMDPDGGVGQVLAVHDHGPREVWRVTMKDGGWTECCDEHLWSVYHTNDRTRGTGPRTLPLSHIRNHLTYERGGSRISQWFLPLCEVDGFARKLPLDPWLLGVLLGNGCFRGGGVRFSSADPDVVARVRGLLERCDSMRQVPGSIVDYRFSGGRLLSRIRELGLLGKLSVEKAIPSVYLSSTRQSRMSLLRGLMDTDGDCTKTGVSVFSTSSPHLRDQVVDLVRGMGGIASVYTNQAPAYSHNGERRVGQPSFRVNVRLGECPFSIKRKAERWRNPILARAIRHVDNPRTCPVRCIEVSTKRHLYITRDHIVTHNTASAIGMLSDPRARPALVVTLAHLPRQWQAELAKFAPGLHTHVLKTATPYDLTVPQNRGRRRASADQLPLMRQVPDVLISTYHKLDGWATTLAPIVRSVVYDECQELRRGHKSQKGSAASILSEAAVYRLGLSATPVYNYGGEIYNVLQAVRPGALGDYDEFAREWCGGAGGGQAVRDPRALGGYLREQGIMLRRTRVDVGRELPPISHVPYEIDHDQHELAKIHGDIEALARVLLSDTEAKKGDRMQAAGEIDMRLRQATGLSKAEFVADWVRLVVEGGQKVVLFGWHRAVYDVWMRALAPLRPVLYTGTESAAQKAAARDAFVNGDAQVLVMSLRSGAGLDGLQQVCSTVVFGELDWSPGVHEQCVGRVARDGQTQPVFAYYLLASEGSDPVVSDVLGIKKGQISGIRDDAALEAMEQAPEGRVRELARAFLGSAA